MRLMICEKKDQAEKVAAAMSLKQGRGCFQGRFEGDELKVVWARGHVLTLCTPDEVKPGISWQDPASLTPIPRDYRMRIADDIPKAPPAAQPKYYIQNIKRFMDEGPREVIIGTDPDREGEAIGWEILEHLRYRGPVRRAWMAAGLSKKSIRDALGSLRPPERTKGWWRASEARSRADWAFMFLVRAYTYYAGYSCFGGNLGQGKGREGVMSVGRVQTPALALIVRRELDIRDFVPKDHYVINGTFSRDDAAVTGPYKPRVTQAIIDEQPAGITWEPSKVIPKEGEPDPLDMPLFTGKAEVDAFARALREKADQARVVAYHEGTKTESPPKTFSLTDAQAHIGKKLGIDSSLVQVILEDLYEQGYTSYARTAQSDLPINFYEHEELHSLLEAVCGVSRVSTQARRALAIHQGRDPKIPAFTPGVFTRKDLEHHGIIPTHEVMTDARLAALTPKKASSRGGVKHTAQQMRDAYLMVAERFVQALYPPATYATQEIEVHLPVKDLLGHDVSRFVIRGSRLTDPGWRAAFGINTDQDTSLPRLQEGETLRLTDLSLKKQTTTPPRRFTTVTLPMAMENIAREVQDKRLRKLLRDSKGIGTPATRKTILETFEARKYITVKRQAIHATEKSLDLVKHVEGWLASPEETALWEDYLIKICAEQDDRKAQEMRDEFVTKITNRVEKLINKLRATHNERLGPRIGGSAGTVTPRMKKAIQSIADEKNLNIDKDTLADAAKARAFLDAHASNGGSRAPSSAQKAFAQKILANLPASVEPPANVLDEAATCSAFIDKHKGYAPPSEGMIKFARNLAAELSEAEQPDESVFHYTDACRRFLDKHGGKNSKPSSRGKRGGGSRRAPSPTRRGAGPGR